MATDGISPALASKYQIYYIFYFGFIEISSENDKILCFKIMLDFGFKIINSIQQNRDCFIGDTHCDIDKETFTYMKHTLRVYSVIEICFFDIMYA